MCAQRLITARKMCQQDLNIVLSWRNHPNVRRFMLTQHEIKLHEHHAWFDRSSKDETKALLVIVEDGAPIGCVIFMNMGIKSTADWSFYVDPEGKPGAGHKVCLAALDVAFNKLKLHKVAGQVLDFNEASIRLHRRLGFTQEGILREHCLIDGAYRDLLCFGLFAFHEKN